MLAKTPAGCDMQQESLRVLASWSARLRCCAFKPNGKVRKYKIAGEPWMLKKSSNELLLKNSECEINTLPPATKRATKVILLLLLVSLFTTH